MKKKMAAAMVLFVVFAFVPTVMAETVPAVDPQSLVGEWWGEWRIIAGVSSGRIYITVKKIEGNKVFGIIEVSGADRYLGYEKFEGTLEGNVLSITLSRLWLNLVIKGKTMEGYARGGQESNLKLNKRK